MNEITITFMTESDYSDDEFHEVQNILSDAILEMDDDAIEDTIDIKLNPEKNAISRQDVIGFLSKLEPREIFEIGLEAMPDDV